MVDFTGDSNTETVNELLEGRPDLVRQATLEKPQVQGEALRCDMQRDCTNPVTHIDDKGFVYCTTHGVNRRGGGYRCRKLRPHERRRLEKGLTISY